MHKNIDIRHFDFMSSGPNMSKPLIAWTCQWRLEPLMPAVRKRHLTSWTNLFQWCKLRIVIMQTKKWFVCCYFFARLTVRLCSPHLVMRFEPFSSEVLEIKMLQHRNGVGVFRVLGSVTNWIFSLNFDKRLSLSWYSICTNCMTDLGLKDSLASAQESVSYVRVSDQIWSGFKL